MTNKIFNGDYVAKSDGTGLETVDYIDELLQNIKINLTARRGSFYPNKDFGSLIRAEKLENPMEEYALAYARQSLDNLNGVFVKSALINGNILTINLEINNTERQVEIELENNL